VVDRQVSEPAWSLPASRPAGPAQAPVLFSKLFVALKFVHDFYKTVPEFLKLVHDFSNLVQTNFKKFKVHEPIQKINHF
jgi:hypothetical protein